MLRQTVLLTALSAAPLGACVPPTESEAPTSPPPAEPRAAKPVATAAAAASPTPDAPGSERHNEHLFSAFERKKIGAFGLWSLSVACYELESKTALEAAEERLTSFCHCTLDAARENRGDDGWEFDEAKHSASWAQREACQRFAATSSSRRSASPFPMPEHDTTAFIVALVDTCKLRLLAEKQALRFALPYCGCEVDAARAAGRPYRSAELTEKCTAVANAAPP